MDKAWCLNHIQLAYYKSKFIREISFLQEMSTQKRNEHSQVVSNSQIYLHKIFVKTIAFRDIYVIWLSVALPEWTRDDIRGSHVALRKGDKWRGSRPMGAGMPGAVTSSSSPPSYEQTKKKVDGEKKNSRISFERVCCLCSTRSHPSYEHLLDVPLPDNESRRRRYHLRSFTNDGGCYAISFCLCWSMFDRNKSRCSTSILLHRHVIKRIWVKEKVEHCRFECI